MTDLEMLKLFTVTTQQSTRKAGEAKTGEKVSKDVLWRLELSPGV